MRTVIRVYNLVILVPVYVTSILYEQHGDKHIDLFLESLGPAIIDLRETTGFVYTIIENVGWYKSIYFHGELNKEIGLHRHGTLFGEFIKYTYNETAYPWQLSMKDVTFRPSDRIYYWLNVSAIIGLQMRTQQRYFGLTENGTLYHSKENITSKNLDSLGRKVGLNEDSFIKLHQVLGSLNMP